MSAVRERRVVADGVGLRVCERGSVGAPVLLLHGFTGSAETLAELAEGLRPRRSFCIDLVGHGGSDAPADAAAYTLAACARQLAGLLDALGEERVHLLGYSMGGRAALHFCAARPERALSALLIGASAGLADPEERAARVRADDALARSILRDGVPAFVERWMALPLFASQQRLGAAALARAREQRLRNRAHGLALSLRGMGSGAQEPLHESLGRMDLPVLLVAGSEDAKFTAIARELARDLPRARLALLPRAGHAAHLENPTGLLAEAEAFLREVESAPRPHTHPTSTPRERRLA